MLSNSPGWVRQRGGGSSENGPQARTVYSPACSGWVADGGSASGHDAVGAVRIFPSLLVVSHGRCAGLDAGRRVMPAPGGWAPLSLMVEARC